MPRQRYIPFLLSWSFEPAFLRGFLSLRSMVHQGRNDRTTNEFRQSRKLDKNLLKMKPRLITEGDQWEGQVYRLIWSCRFFASKKLYNSSVENKVGTDFLSFAVWRKKYLHSLSNTLVSSVCSSLTSYFLFTHHNSVTTSTQRGAFEISFTFQKSEFLSKILKLQKIGIHIFFDGDVWFLVYNKEEILN